MMTPARLAFLYRAADLSFEPGTALMFEYNNGFMLQVRWALGKKFVQFTKGKVRLVITQAGRDALASFERGRERRARDRDARKSASDRLLAALENEERSL